MMEGGYMLALPAVNLDLNLSFILHLLACMANIADLTMPPMFSIIYLNGMLWHGPPSLVYLLTKAVDLEPFNFAVKCFRRE